MASVATPRPGCSRCSERNAHDDIAARLNVLCAEQIRAAMAEAATDINALVTRFLSAARDIEGMADAGEAAGDRDALIRETFMDAIVRLQFGDRLTQRLANVCNNLSAAAAFLNKHTDNSGADLDQLLTTVRSSFTMQHEREQFDAAFAEEASATLGANDD